MKLPEIIWLTTGTIVFIAVASHTNLVKNLINKVKNPPHGFYFVDGPSFGSNTSHCYQDGQEVPCGYFEDDCGYFDPVTQLQEEQLQSQQQPNFTQPLVSPNINKEIESQIPKEHKKKHKSESEAHAQIECPDDPNTLPCGSNCYKNGQLWKTVCSEDERQALFPPSNQETPYNYNPYRSGGGPSPPYPIPTDIQPQNNIHPTTPEQNLQNQFSQYNPYALSYQQQTTMQPTTPGGQLSLQRSCQPVNGWVPEPPHKSDITASNCDCGKTKLKSSGYVRDSCRKFNSNIGLTDYTIYATVDVGEQTDQSGNSSNRIEITSGGPGIGEKDGCCGVGMDLNLEDGSPHIEIENWSPGAKNRDDPICDGESCRQYGWDGVRLGNLYGKPGGQPTRVSFQAARMA
jgi:hypothetical protein